MKAILALEDGTIFHGESFGAEGEVIGEIVFNTGMTGYQEVLTDPSYCGQIVTMTYPLIGNYNYLKKNNIIGIDKVDTRALTRILRDKGTMKGLITTDPDFNFDEKIDEIRAYVIKDPVMCVTTNEVLHYKGDGFKVALIDLGLKQNIVRSLLKRGCDVHVFPANSKAEDVLSINPDGIMLSNGPGDPKDCVDTIDTIKELMGKKPMFGICLGHQLTALANGADTEKLKYGHRGANHPVKDIEKDLTYITSQNHGYTIVESSMDKSRMLVSHINMNDGTVEGVRYTNVPVFTVQFHPEASPGPEDTAYLFDEFIEMMKRNSQ